MLLSLSQVVDERARLQLDYLSFATKLKSLRHLSAGIILSRAVMETNSLRWLLQVRHTG